MRGREEGKGSFGNDYYQYDPIGKHWERVSPAHTIQPTLAGASMLHPQPVFTLLMQEVG